jgi:pSer/pThr/pTyr-binding forkhead associated (FHA) protein
MSPAVLIAVREGGRVCQEWELEKPASYTAGRSSSCELRLPTDEDHLQVSRRHCQFEIEPSAVWVRDLGSLNGTYVNDVCIGGRWEPGDPDSDAGERFPLHSGDEVRLGNTVLRVEIRGAEEPASGEKADAPRQETYYLGA